MTRSGGQFKVVEVAGVLELAKGVSQTGLMIDRLPVRPKAIIQPNFFERNCFEMAIRTVFGTNLHGRNSFADLALDWLIVIIEIASRSGSGRQHSTARLYP
jgi:hypothetical protein